MKPSLLVALVVLAFAAAVAVLVVLGVTLVRRLQSLAQTQSGLAAEVALDAMRRERGESMQAILDATLSVASSKLGDQLEAGKYVIDREHQAVVEQVAGVHSELRRVSELVAVLQRERAEHEGRLGERLDNAMVVTTQLAATTTSLREALASPKSRGQWGERMAEDVLRMAGFVEGVNYTKQTLLAGGGLPDYSFRLPKGHVVHMDVKFPIDNYLRSIEADAPDGAEVVHSPLRVIQLAAEKSRQTVRSNRDHFLFTPLVSSATTGTITVCDDRGSRAARAVLASSSARDGAGWTSVAAAVASRGKTSHRLTQSAMDVMSAGCAWRCRDEMSTPMSAQHPR